MVKKNPSPAYSVPITAAAGTQSANPLTPPNSDGSNYSTTPSPHDTNAAAAATAAAAVHGVLRGAIHAAHPENPGLQASSVMLSPYSDHHNGSGCSPPQMVLFLFDLFSKFIFLLLRQASRCVKRGTYFISFVFSLKIHYIKKRRGGVVVICGAAFTTARIQCPVPKPSAWKPFSLQLSSFFLWQNASGVLNVSDSNRLLLGFQAGGENCRYPPVSRWLLL